MKFSALHNLTRATEKAHSKGKLWAFVVIAAFVRFLPVLRGWHLSFVCPLDALIPRSNI